MDRRNGITVNKPSSPIINLSNIHINEISKGAQKLNQILRACSNGVTFDGYSVEIGRELLKGAMDLEESLRMLANLQEASEKVTNHQRKSQIKLLNENGEEEDDEERDLVSPVPHQKLVERPRFSFDKPSRKSEGNKKAINSDPHRSVMALTYTSEAMTLSRKHSSSTSNVAPHKRSASCGPDFRPEKGRTPNIIAKLMGLEDGPPSVNFESKPSQSNSKHKEGMVSKSNVNTNGKTVEKMTKNAEYVAHTSPENNGFKFPFVKSQLNDLERVGGPKSVSGPQFTEKFPGFDQSPNDLHIKMKRQGTKKYEEDACVERRQAKRVVDHNHKDAEAKRIRKGISDRKDINLKKEKRNTDTEEKPRAAEIEKREQQHIKEKYHVRKEKGTGPKPKNQMVPNKQSSKELHDERPYMVSTNIKNGRSMNLTANTKNLVLVSSSHRGIPKEKVSKGKSLKGYTAPIKENKSTRTVATERMRDHIEVHKRESPGRKDEVMTKRNETQQNAALTLEDQILALQKGKQLRLARSTKGEAERLSDSNSKEAQIHILSPNKSEAGTKMLLEDLPSEKEAEVCIVSPNKSEAGSKMLIEDLLSDKEAEQDLALSSSKGSEFQSLTTNLPTPTESSQDMATEIPVDPDDKEGRLPSLNKNTGLKPQNFELHSGNGCKEASLDNSNPQHEKKENSVLGSDELLTESEIQFKQTLLKSRLFLNIAEALFNLSIPDNILLVTDYSTQDDDSKVMLDCAYEIMRRKGKRQDLSLYPSLRISIVSAKVTSFDDLVKQLYADIKKLKDICEGTSEEQGDAKAINEMLERDVQNRDPDVNTVWDLGWNEMAFAMIERDELIKDLERYMIDVEIEYITYELLHFNACIG